MSVGNPRSGSVSFRRDAGSTSTTDDVGRGRSLGRGATSLLGDGGSEGATLRPFVGEAGPGLTDLLGTGDCWRLLMVEKEEGGEEEEPLAPSERSASKRLARAVGFGLGGVFPRSNGRGGRGILDGPSSRSSSCRSVGRGGGGLRGPSSMFRSCRSVGRGGGGI